MFRSTCTVPNGQNRPPPQPPHGFVTTPGNLLHFLPKVEELFQIILSFQLIWSEFYNSKFLQKHLPKSGILTPHTPPHTIYGICSSSDCQQMNILSPYVVTEAMVHIQIIDLLRVIHYVEVHDSGTNFAVGYFLTAYSACLASSPFLMNTKQ